MQTIDLISQRTSVLPETMQQEVLDFVEFLFTKLNRNAEQQQPHTRIAGLHSGQAVIASM